MNDDRRRGDVGLSHNATLKTDGLEAMTSPDLVAFIPVDQKTAHKRKPPWRMPWGDLRAALDANNVAGRVILSDPGESEAEQTRPPAQARAAAARL